MLPFISCNDKFILSSASPKILKATNLLHNHSASSLVSNSSIPTNTKKPFYVWDPDTKNKVYLNARAAWWNDQDWHGGDAIKEQSYAIRIDGKFTEEFRKLIGIDHLDTY